MTTQPEFGPNFEAACLLKIIFFIILISILIDSFNKQSTCILWHCHQSCKINRAQFIFLLLFYCTTTVQVSFFPHLRKDQKPTPQNVKLSQFNFPATFMQEIFLKFIKIQENSNILRVDVFISLIMHSNCLETPLTCRDIC